MRQRSSDATLCGHAVSLADAAIWLGLKKNAAAEKAASGGAGGPHLKRWLKYVDALPASVAMAQDYFGQQNPYLFDYQVPHFYEHDPIHQGRVLLDPTDTYKFYCRYDTRDKTSTTMGGDRTQDEMCLFFMGYYPTTPAVLKDKGLEWCLGAPFCEGGADTCGFEHYPF